ncbi:MAG: DUF2807 domain-containing protein [Fimbriimonadaceae bacterium]|nr:DUF2807 domain-containing protein [Fimbriimonadaceae bacterium]QYK59047.1 MAG: DUF2807 domain-containing protein [Fimbriimonadaceae bacterium]
MLALLFMVSVLVAIFALPIGLVGMASKRSVTINTQTNSEPEDLAAVSQEFEGVESIEIAGSLDLVWSPAEGPTTSVKITGPSRSSSRVKAQLRGSTLVVSNSSSRSSSGVRVEVTGPQPNSFHTSGSGSIEAIGLEGKPVGIVVSGSGVITAVGSAPGLSIDVTGSGQVKAAGLEAETVTSRMSGSGLITVGETKQLEANISGSGQILYQGDPKVSSDVNGSGSIRKLKPR